MVEVLALPGRPGVVLDGWMEAAQLVAVPPGQEWTHMAMEHNGSGVLVAALEVHMG